MKLPSFIVLLRIPFSYYLVPVFLFAFSFANEPDLEKGLWFFVVLHFFIYPASNGYNSFMDKDVSSIGGLKNPPPPDKWLLIASFILNLSGIALSYIMDPILSCLVLVYVLVSMAYSWHGIRLKKHAIPGFVSVVVFQGFWVYSMVFLFCQKVDYLQAMVQTNYLIPAIISSLMVAAAYPMTQVYQHKADEKSGDHTLSRLLGLKGTFEFCGTANLIMAVWMGYFLSETDQSHLFYMFLIFVFPVMAFFLWWAGKVWSDPTQANFRYTMMLNKISSTAMILFFILVYFVRSTNELPI